MEMTPSTRNRADGADGRPRRLNVWEVDAAAARTSYEDEVVELLALDGQAAGPQNENLVGTALLLAETRLDEAKKVIECDPGRGRRTSGRIVEYWTGKAHQEAWQAIHEADVVLTYARSADHIRAELPGLRQRVRLRVDDDLYREDLLERLKAIEGALDAGAKKARDEAATGQGGSSSNKLAITDADRTAVAHAIQEVYVLSDRGYEYKRNFRNIILVTTLIAALVALLLAMFGLFDDTITYRLDLYPKTGRKLWPETIWPVELIGALAGFIVAITALRRLQGQGPYSLRVVQASLKVPAGALTAVTGMLLLQSGTFGVGPVSTKGEFVAWAFVFGASQELITRFVDQKAASVAEKTTPSG